MESKRPIWDTPYGSRNLIHGGTWNIRYKQGRGFISKKLADKVIKKLRYKRNKKQNG